MDEECVKMMIESEWVLVQWNLYNNINFKPKFDPDKNITGKIWKS